MPEEIAPANKLYTAWSINPAPPQSTDSSPLGPWRQRADGTFSPVNTEAGQLTKELADLKESHARQQETIRTQMFEIMNEKKRADQSQHALKNADARSQSCGAAATEATRELADLKVERSELSGCLEKARQEVWKTKKALTDQRGVFDRQVEALKKRVEELEADRVALVAELKSASQNNGMTEHQKLAFAAQVNYYQDLTNDLRDDREELEEERDYLRGRVRQLERTLNTLKQVPK